MARGKWDAFDVLGGILTYMDVKNLPASVPRLHNAFYSLTRKKKYQPFMNGYLFQKRTGFYFSERLQTYLENMEIAGSLSCGNPDFSEYEIKQKLRTSFEKYAKKSFSAQELQTLSAMARDFKKNMSQEETTQVSH